jgi:putative ABC transport system ATP-binding protein
MNESGNHASPALVQLSDVHKSYNRRGLNEEALRGVSLAVEDGEYVCVAGPSGSGKSTLLSILAFLDQPTSGTYRFRGRDISEVGLDEQATLRNREIGLVFQNFNLISTLSVAENIELPLIYRGMRSGERRLRVAERLEQFDLNRRADHFPEELSGGEQQRVAVARALVGRPSLILADEPTGNLDQRNGETIMDILSVLNSLGSTIVLVTHDVRFIIKATRTISLTDGTVLPSS